ncbi:MAG: serine/threonine-protein kinase [Kofleriaceae bacterium]
MTKYPRHKLLGKGAMGEVYAAHDAAGEPVAVKHVRKTLAMDRSVVERFANESRLLERVMHHNVVRKVEHGTGTDGQPQLVMSYVPGITLRQVVDVEGPLSIDRAFAITAQILTGLSAIHDAKVVHADIKSSNVLIGDQDRVTIIDFGLARTLSRELPPEDTLAGTPAFMAPELITGGAPSVAADLYAVGVILYEMLAGVTPFASSADIFEAHVNEPVVPPSVRVPERALSAAIDRLVLRALAKTPAARFASARDFAAVLDAALMGEALMSTVELARVRITPSSDLETRPTRQWAGRTAMPPVTAEAVPVTRVHDMISATLDRAGKLIDKHDPRAAVFELEAGLAMLVRGPGSAEPDLEAWRIESVLAALYDSLGRRSQAQQTALAAHQHAVAIGCPIAAGRTRALVARLNANAAKPPPRLARGSGRFTRHK